MSDPTWLDRRVADNAQHLLSRRLERFASPLSTEEMNRLARECAYMAARLMWIMPEAVDMFFGEDAKTTHAEAASDEQAPEPPCGSSPSSPPP